MRRMSLCAKESNVLRILEDCGKAARTLGTEPTYEFSDRMVSVSWYEETNHRASVSISLADDMRGDVLSAMRDSAIKIVHRYYPDLDFMTDHQRAEAVRIAKERKENAEW